MNHRSTTILETRERWLPFIQQFALNNSWDLGNDIERLVDEVLPYLATATTADDAQRILTNYYHDAPLIQLLLQTPHRSGGIWEQFRTLCITLLQKRGVGAEGLASCVAQIEDKTAELLAEHTYQAPLFTIFIAACSPCSQPRKAPNREEDTDALVSPAIRAVLLCER